MDVREHLPVRNFPLPLVLNQQSRVQSLNFANAGTRGNALLIDSFRAANFESPPEGGDS